jgi:hypothetical protein
MVSHSMIDAILWKDLWWLVVHLYYIFRVIRDVTNADLRNSNLQLSTVYWYLDAPGMSSESSLVSRVRGVHNTPNYHIRDTWILSIAYF